MCIVKKQIICTCRTARVEKRRRRSVSIRVVLFNRKMTDASVLGPEGYIVAIFIICRVRVPLSMRLRWQNEFDSLRFGGRRRRDVLLICAAARKNPSTAATIDE